MTTNAGYKKVLIVGDFNHPNIQWTPAPVISTNHISDNHPEVQFVDMINDSLLQQHISEPTRDRDGQTPTIDDLIFTSDPDIIDDIQHLPHLGASDHQCLKFNIHCTFNKCKPKVQTRYNYHKADMKKLNQMLDIDWDAELANKSADDGTHYS